MEAYTSFAELLRDYRRNMGWTQSEMAEKWNFSVDTISAWERGVRKPSKTETPRLARYLSVDTSEIVKALQGSKLNGKQTPTITANQWQNAFDTWGELQQIFRSRTDFNREFSYPKMFAEAKQIIAVGISLNAIALNYDRQSLIDSIVNRECHYQLCLLEPYGSFCQMRETEEGHEEGTLSDLTRINIRHLLGVRKTIQKAHEEHAQLLEIRQYNLPPRFNIYIVDDQIMTVQWYAYGRGEDTPTFVMKRQESKGLFDFYANAAKHILQHSVPVE